MGPDGEETRAQNVQKPSELLSSPETSSLLQDLQPSDSTSFILLNLTRAGNSLVCHLADYVSDNRMQEISSTSLSLLLRKGKGHKICWALLDIPAAFNHQQLPTVQRSVKTFSVQQLHLCNEC